MWSGRLAEFFAAFALCGVVSAPTIEMETGDSPGTSPGPDSLPGSAHIRERRAKRSAEPRVAGGRRRARPERALPLSIDLAEWVRIQRTDPGTLLADSPAWGASRTPVSSSRGRPGDEAQPAGPIRLQAGCGPLSPEEIVAGSAFPSRIRVDADRRDRETDAPATPPAPAGNRDGGRGSAATPGPPQEPDRTASLRINVELLDRLMTLTSELTLIRNQSLLAFDQDDDQLRPIVQRLDAVTSSLQETVLRTRMQPIGNLFGKFPRVVRDLARQLGKQVEMTVVGRDVELDKTILEQLSDPLTHLVRNSVDHGIEAPAERVAKGKPATGRITLTAAHEEGQIRIEIRDDGRGIDPQAVRDKALAMRLKTEAELDRMSPRELFSLILLPGFSTARSVSEVSGRGVGMDVVKTNIELLEGSLTIDSQPGARHGDDPPDAADAGDHPLPDRHGERRALRHPAAGTGRSGLSAPRDERADRACVRHGGLSVARPAPADRADKRRAEPAQPFTAETKARDPGRARRERPIRSESRTSWCCGRPAAASGWWSTRSRGTEEIVVKPMHPSIKRVGIFTGATIMGDGRVALIADVAGIVEHARLSFEPATAAVASGQEPRKAAQTHRVLLFENGPQEQFAMPLLQIRRIEMVGLDRIERVGEHEYVTVDGVSMRVLRLDKVINVSAPEPPRRIPPRRCR